MEEKAKDSNIKAINKIFDDKTEQSLEQNILTKTGKNISAGSSWPTEARCFWMRSEKYPSNYSRGCYAYFRKENLNGSAAPKPSKQIFLNVKIRSKNYLITADKKSTFTATILEIIVLLNSNLEKTDNYIYICPNQHVQYIIYIKII